MASHAPLHAGVIALMLLAGACSGPAPAPAVVPEATAPSTAPPPAPARASAHLIVVLGDSLSAGFGLDSADALPDQLQQRLRARGLDVSVVNAGVSGDTTANGLARYDWSVGSLEPDTVIIALGANDYLLGLSSEVAHANLAKLIETAQADGTAVILAGLEPRHNAPAGSRDAAFAAIYPALAERYDVLLYPALMQGVRDTPALLQADGLHPTADGVGVMADRMAAVLAPFLEAEAGQPVSE